MDCRRIRADPGGLVLDGGTGLCMRKGGERNADFTDGCGLGPAGEVRRGRCTGRIGVSGQQGGEEVTQPYA